MDQATFSEKLAFISGKLLAQMSEALEKEEKETEGQGYGQEEWLLSVMHTAVVLGCTHAAAFIALKGGVESEEEIEQVMGRIFPAVQSALQSEMDRELTRLQVGDMANTFSMMPKRPGHA